MLGIDPFRVLKAAFLSTLMRSCFPAPSQQPEADAHVRSATEIPPQVCIDGILEMGKDFGNISGRELRSEHASL